MRGVQPEAGQVHVADLWCLFKASEYAFDLVRIVRLHPPPISLLEQEFETLMAEASYHMSSVTTHLSFPRGRRNFLSSGKDHPAISWEGAGSGRIRQRQCREGSAQTVALQSIRFRYACRREDPSPHRRHKARKRIKPSYKHRQEKGGVRRARIRSDEAAGASRLPLSSTARHRIVRLPDPSGFHS